MAENTRQISRIPVILDSINSENTHKINELVLNDKGELNITKSYGYYNIGSDIKARILNASNNRSIVHICTEDTLPPVQDRKINHWYYVVTKSQFELYNKLINEKFHIYYGIVDKDTTDFNYYSNMTDQNMISESSIIRITITSNDKIPYFCIPHGMILNNITLGAYFLVKNSEGKYELVVPTKKQSNYMIANIRTNNLSVPYDIYIIDTINTVGTYDIYVNVSYPAKSVIMFGTADESISGLILPDYITTLTDSSIGVDIPEEPYNTDNNKIFLGWSSDKSSLVIADDEYVPTEMYETLYAFWQEESDAKTKYSYHVSNKYANTGETFDTYSGIITRNESITPKEVSGYTPDKDYAIINSSAQHVVFKYALTVYNIIYNLNGGSISGQKDTYTVEDVKSDPYIPPTPTKAGYNFDKWNPVNIPKGSFGDWEFNAIWGDPISYNITYNLSGKGTMSGQKDTYTVEDLPYYPPNPIDISAGWNFDGWIPERLSAGTTGNQKFTAQWSAIQYNITYVLNGGSISGQKTFYTVEDSTYTPPTPTRSGYDFDKWTPENIPTGSIGDKTFTASWKSSGYSISYVLFGGSLTGQKTSYKSSDDDYYPPTPTHSTSTNKFVLWYPEALYSGTTGDYTFAAGWADTSISMLITNIKTVDAMETSHEYSSASTTVNIDNIDESVDIPMSSEIDGKPVAYTIIKYYLTTSDGIIERELYDWSMCDYFTAFSWRQIFNAIIPDYYSEYESYNECSIYNIGDIIFVYETTI